MRLASGHLGAQAALVWLCLASSAFAANKPNPYLAQAKVFYQGLEYEKCVARLEQASRWPSEPAEQVEVELYNGLCRFNMGDLDEAKRHFDLSLELDASTRLPPFTSPRISDTFEAERKKVQAKLAREGKLKQKSEEKLDKPVIVDEQKPKTEVAANDTPKKTDLEPKPRREPEAFVTEKPEEGPSHALSYGLGAGAVAFAGVGAVFGLQAKSLEGQLKTPNNQSVFYESDARKVANQASTDATIANVGFAVAGAAAIAAVTTYVLAK